MMCGKRQGERYASLQAAFFSCQATPSTASCLQRMRFAEVEQVVDLAVGREEALRAAGRFELFHCRSRRRIG
jgi:hypothetical protein